jgi:integrase
MLTLTAFARQYVDCRQVSAAYAGNLAKRAAALELFAGQRDVRELLTEPIVNAFLRSLNRASATVRSYRSDVLSLWNAAADLDIVPYPVMRRIYQPDVPRLVVECYTVEEVRAILAAAKRVVGDYPNGVAKSRYWTAAILLAWDTGIRRGDVWLFRRDAVRPDGSVRIVQHKTGQLVTAKLRPVTVAAIQVIGLPQPLKWSLDPSFFGRHFAKIVKQSGVCRGSFKWLRRASGSYVEMIHPGAGHKHLGHSTPQIFDRHYDAKLGGHTLPQPPEL